VTAALCRTARCLIAAAAFAACNAAAAETPARDHPRLYFTADELAALRARPAKGVRAAIWENIRRSADWCAEQPPRTAWIPTLEPDPQFENLYDRFYAAMHDTAIVEHLAFASALSDPEQDPYREPARAWLLAAARVWKNEATNKPDASKAYAVLRIAKGMAVAYDLLFHDLSDSEQREVRDAIAGIGRAYFEFFQLPSTAGEGYNKHHGSVDAAPLGILALALLGDEPEAQAWLDVAVEKHVDYLLPHALTPSGTNDQSSNFWASTLQYRIFFIEPLRRVTGRDLFAEFPTALPGRIALAAVADGQPRDLSFNEPNRSVLFGPCYGQVDYWSPVLLYLARHDRRPIYQRLALWDESLGALQRTRFVTPNAGEQLLFCFGPYAYLWYDDAVEPGLEERLPYSFAFPEPEVSEAYLRSSYDHGDVVVGMRKGEVIVHAGGHPVLVDQFKLEAADPAAGVKELLVDDDGRRAAIRCVGPEAAGLQTQLVELHRPSRVTLRRDASRPLTWWHAGQAERDGNSLAWAGGVRLVVTTGEITDYNPRGWTDEKVHFGGMRFADPHPFTYPTVTVAPADGRIVVEISAPAAQPPLASARRPDAAARGESQPPAQP